MKGLPGRAAFFYYHQNYFTSGFSSRYAGKQFPMSRGFAGQHFFSIVIGVQVNQVRNNAVSRKTIFAIFNPNFLHLQN